MQNIKICKSCPFCPQTKSAYVFKTYHGLYRHIWRWHILDEEGNRKFNFLEKEAKKIRIYLTKFSKFRDVKVYGKKHIDAIIEAYVKGWNPSLRDVISDWNGKKK